MFDLTGMTALVTGASGGIGSAIAQALAAQGARLAVSGSNADKLNAFRDTLGGDHVALPCNLGDAAAVDALVPSAIDALGQLDILVNNAGVSHMPAPLDEISEADFDRVLAVNVKSVYFTSRAFVPHFKARKSGTILNVARPRQ